MKRIYTKGEIKYRALCENNKFFTIPKANMRLREDSESNAYVKPTQSNSNASSLASDLAKAASENPTDDTFIVDTSNYDSNSQNQKPTLNIKAKNTTDASKQYMDLIKNPAINQLTKSKGANVEIELQNESIQYRRNNSIPFTKSELEQILHR